MSNVVAFQRPTAKAEAKPPAVEPRPPRRYAARLGWWALGAACAAPAAMLAALRPFILVAYWFGVVWGLGVAIFAGWLLVPHLRTDHLIQGGVLFFGALILRHGSDALRRGLQAGKIYCDARPLDDGAMRKVTTPSPMGAAPK